MLTSLRADWLSFCLGSPPTQQQEKEKEMRSARRQARALSACKLASLLLRFFPRVRAVKRHAGQKQEKEYSTQGSRVITDLSTS